MKPQKQKNTTKRLKRVYQPAVCIVHAKLRRIAKHLATHEDDEAAQARLLVLERIAKLSR